MGLPSEKSVTANHMPSWKVRRNPFALVQPNSNRDDAKDKRQSFVPSNDKQLLRHDEDKVYIYEDSDDIHGVVTLTVAPGKQAEHLGVKVEFVGQIELHQSYDGRPSSQFISQSKLLESPNIVISERTFPFSFCNVDKVHESYGGKNVSVRYFIRVSVERKFLPPIRNECDFIVQKVQTIPPTVNDPIKMEVGIEECLHIEFEYSRRKYHLNDYITGKINFLLVHIKIKNMELAVIRRENVGQIASSDPQMGAAASSIPADPNKIQTQTQTLVKYEIMDGAPVKGETIPVKLYLKGIPADLSPTYENVNNRFAVNYYLNLVLVDDEDRRYFKQQEIILWRKELG